MYLIRERSDRFEEKRIESFRESGRRVSDYNALDPR